MKLNEGVGDIKDTVCKDWCVSPGISVFSAIQPEIYCIPEGSLS